MTNTPRLTYYYQPTGDIQKDAAALARSANGDLSDLKCTQCDAPHGGCSCWQTCGCGWLHLDGEDCRNPVHELAADVSFSFIGRGEPSNGKSLLCLGAIGVLKQ